MDSIGMRRRLAHRKSERGCFWQLLPGIAVLWVAASPAVAQDLPALRKALEMVGYEIVDHGVSASQDGKPVVELGSPPKTALRVVSKTIKILPAFERGPADPWIDVRTELRYGEQDTMPRDILEYPVRVHVIVLDSMMQKVQETRTGTLLRLREGQPSLAATSTGVQLQSPLKSGVVIWMILCRDSDDVPWQVLSYQLSTVNQLN